MHILAWIGIVLVVIVVGLVAYTALNALSAERKVPRVGQFIEVNGARIHYVDLGAGPTMVLVHGLGAESHNYTYKLTERLTRDHRVIVIDRPGAGYSVPAPGAHPDLKAQAAIVAGVITRLGLDRPLLVGHSLGGAVALALGLDHPELVRGLALIAPLTQPQEDIPVAFKALIIPSDAMRRIIGWTLAAPMGKLNRLKGLEMVFGPEAIPADYDTAGGGALTLRPNNFFAASSEVSHGSGELVEMGERYPGLTPPVAVLFGRGDRILDPEVHGRRLAATVPGLALEIVDGGHMIPLTQPGLTADWLRRLDSAIE